MSWYFYRSVLMLIILSFSCCSFNQSAKPQSSYEYVLYKPRKQPINISIDERFSQQQQNLLSLAIKKLEDKSEHKIKFITKWNVKRPKPYLKDWSVETFNNIGIFIWYVEKNEKELTHSQIKEYDNDWGITVTGWNKESVNVIIFTEVPITHFYATSLHELGHLVGMNHIEKPSVMFKYVRVACFTDLDAMELCDLYGCVAKPDCLSKEQY